MECNKESIIKVLEQKMPNVECPMCHNKHFYVLDGYDKVQSYSDLNFLKLDSKVMPVVVTVCSNCGFVSYHALGALGLINNDNQNSVIEDYENKNTIKEDIENSDK